MISVYTIITDYWQDRFCLESAVKNAGCDFRLIVGTQSDNAFSVTSFLESLINEDKKYPFIMAIDEVEKAEMDQIDGWKYAYMIKRCPPTDLACILDINSVVQKNWLYDLCLYYKEAKNPGILSIAEFKYRQNFTNVIDKNDSLMPVWKSKNNTVRDILFFDVDAFSGVDFDKCSIQDHQSYFCHQANKLGKECFYLPNQIRIKI